MDVRLAKVNVQSATAYGVIRVSKLLLWKTEMLRNTLDMCPSLLAEEETDDRYNQDAFTAEK